MKKEIKKQYAIAQIEYGVIRLHKGGMTFEEGEPKLYTLTTAKQILIKMRKNKQHNLVVVRYNNGIENIIDY